MHSTLVIRLGHHGEGLLETGGFAPFTLPGERVAVDPPHQVKEASEDRVAPGCPQFGTCGGCALQHASDGFLRAWKQDVVRRALLAQGLNAEVREGHTSPPASRRRAVLAARRTRKGVQVGFHARRSDQIADIEGCRVLRPEILEVIAGLEPLVRAGASRKGALRIQITASDAGPDMHVTDGKPLDQGLRQLLADAAANMDLARLTWGDELVAMRRPPLVTMGPAQVVPPPGAFLQATSEGQAALAAAVAGVLDGAGGPVLDLFAGCGTFALPLAALQDVHAVEGDADMLAALEAGWRGSSGLRSVSTETRDLFRRPLLAPELTRFAAGVIDPPRAGAAAQVAGLVASEIGRVAMVSCNPVTFARDAAALCAGGFELGGVEVIDQFRWSPHIELVGSFRR